MPLGLTDDHDALAASVREWGRKLGAGDLIRAAEQDSSASFGNVWAEVTALGLPLIAAAGPAGGDGTMLDLAVALEAAASELVPGPILGTAVAATLASEYGAGATGDALADLAAGGSAGVTWDPVLRVQDGWLAGTVVSYDGAGAAWHLVGGVEPDEQYEVAEVEHWFLVADRAVTAEPLPTMDLSRRGARITVKVRLTSQDVIPLPGLGWEKVRWVLRTLAAAEAVGVAQWCLETAVDYAKVREQFGQPIGKFQAIKHLLAEMVQSHEAATAAAWDAASSFAGEFDHSQISLAVDVARVMTFDASMAAAQNCIQVLGGIGFTFEHDAHLYLRRATALRVLGGRSRDGALDVAAQVLEGVRRRVRVDLEGADEIRESIRERVVTIAASADHRDALVRAGYVMPHWPAPYGAGAGALEQLVIDEELAAARIARPDLKIGGWATATLIAHGSEAQRERFVEATLRGDVIWCQLFSEPGAGSDLAALSTRAVRVEGGWELTGQKVWTSLAAQAHWGICLARTNPDAPKHRGITYFLVEMNSPGIDIRPLREMTGDALFNEVFLERVFVPDECVVGEIDGGWRLARTTLSNERVAMASTRLDASVERAIELTRDLGFLDGGERERVGRAAALATVCGQLSARTTLRRLAGRGPGVESSVAKLLGVTSRQEASQLVVELRGERIFDDPAGVADDVHEMLLTRCLSIAGGTTQVLKNVIAEQILGLPR